MSAGVEIATASAPAAASASSESKVATPGCSCDDERAPLRRRRDDAQEVARRRRSPAAERGRRDRRSRSRRGRCAAVRSWAWSIAADDVAVASAEPQRELEGGSTRGPHRGRPRGRAAGRRPRARAADRRPASPPLADGYRIPYDSAALHADLGRGHNVEATVFVECMTSFRPDGDEALRPVGETEFVLRDCPTGATRRTARRVAAGIVGWADLTRPDDVGRTLDGHLEAGQDRFKGVRFNVVWHERHAQPRGPGGATALPPRRRLPARAARGRAPRPHLRRLAVPRAAPRARRHHRRVSRPDLRRESPRRPGSRRADARVAAAIFDEWRRNLADIARRPNAVLKVGGVGMPVYGFGFDGCEPAPLDRARRRVEALRRDRDRAVRTRPLHVREQLPGRQAELQLRRALERVQAPVRRLLRRTNARCCFSGTARRVYRLDTT